MPVHELLCRNNQQSTPSPNTREITDKVEHGTRESALGGALLLIRYSAKSAHPARRPSAPSADAARETSETGERTRSSQRTGSAVSRAPGTSTCPTPTPDSYHTTTIPLNIQKLILNSRARSAHHAPATQTVQPGDGPGYLSGRRAALLHLLHERRHLVRVRGLLIVRDENLPDYLLLLWSGLGLGLGFGLGLGLGLGSGLGPGLGLGLGLGPGLASSAPHPPFASPRGCELADAAATFPR